jgi:hypothetical protein
MNKVVNLEHMIPESAFTDDLFDIIFPMLSKGQLENATCYSGHRDASQVDHCCFADYHVSPYFEAIGRTNKHNWKRFVHFVREQRNSILSRKDTWSWCIDEACNLTRPKLYKDVYYQLTHTPPIRPVHGWLPMWNYKTKVVHIGKKEIGSLSVQRETDEDYKELHYITAAFKVHFSKNRKRRIFSETVLAKCWEEDLDPELYMEEEDLRDIQKWKEDVLIPNITSFLSDQIQNKVGMPLC